MPRSLEKEDISHCEFWLRRTSTVGDTRLVQHESVEIYADMVVSFPEL
jgi:hypothetical protein